MSSMPSVKTAKVNGLELGYYEWGNPGNPVLICLHSHTNTSVSWREFAEFASTKYHVFAIDQRGHGNSDWAKDGYARDRFVEDLYEFIKDNNFEKITLVGCSMGGRHSILYAVDNPDLVQRIVMVDIAPEPSSERMQAPPAPPTPMKFETLEHGFDWLRSGNELASDARLREDTEARLRQTDSGSWTWKADLEGFDNPLPDITDASLISRYWSAIEAIRCPILEIRGVESNLVGDSTIEKMKHLGKEVSSVDVSRAGHVVMVDQPEVFIEAIKVFVRL